MTAKQIVEAVEAAGGSLVRRGERIRYRVPTPAAHLLEELIRNKPDVLRLLKHRDERRTGFAHLLALLGKRVWTPDGPGTLAAVLEDHVTVQYETGGKRLWFDSAVVIPYA